MTTKSATTKGQTQMHAAPQPPVEDLQKAYMIHTLVQMMYGQLAASNPWTVSQMSAMPPGALRGYPTTPWAGGFPMNHPVGTGW